MVQTILPPNRTQLEESVDRATGSRVQGVPVPIDKLWSPQQVPADALPWLAWALSVDIWREDWPESKKRKAVEIAYEMHRKKGTLDGLEQVVNFLGGRFISATTPPSKTFAAPSWTEEAREEWLSKHPELRVYHNRDNGSRAGAMPLNGDSLASAKVFLQPNTRSSPPDTPADGDTYRVSDNPSGAWGNNADDYAVWDGSASAWTFKSAETPASLHAGTAFPSKTTAPKRARPSVFMVQPDGSEKELTTSTFETETVTKEVVEQIPSKEFRGPIEVERGGRRAYRIASPGLRAKGAMISDPEAGAAIPGKLFPNGGGRNHLADKRAYRRVYVTELVDETSYEERKLVRHSVQPLIDKRQTGVSLDPRQGEPIRARAERVSQKGKRRGTMLGAAHPGKIAGAAIPNTYLATQNAESRMYQRTRLFDPSVTLPKSGRSFHLGAMRLGMPPYHAEIRIGLYGKRSPWKSWKFVRGHLVKSSHRQRDDIIKSMRWSASERDKVLVNTTTHQPVTAGVAAIAGSDLVAGAWKGV